MLPTGTYSELLWWTSAGEGGMDHEQTFCPGKLGAVMKDCRADHYAMDFVSYVVWESQALTKMACLLELPDRAKYWTETANNITQAMITHLWDEEDQFFYDRWFNGTRLGSWVGCRPFPCC